MATGSIPYPGLRLASTFLRAPRKRRSCSRNKRAPFFPTSQEYFAMCSAWPAYSAARPRAHPTYFAITVCAPSMALLLLVLCPRTSDERFPRQLEVLLSDFGFSSRLSEIDDETIRRCAAVDEGGASKPLEYWGAEGERFARYIFDGIYVFFYVCVLFWDRCITGPHARPSPSSVR